MFVVSSERSIAGESFASLTCWSHGIPLQALSPLSQQMRKFGDDKRDLLTPQCQQCEVLALCNGGCPKDRFALSRDGDSGHNYLCSGLELFFLHTRPAMRTMGRLLQQRRAPSEVMAITAAEDEKRGPYQNCSCGSGRKFRFCHGDMTPNSPFTGIRSAT